MPYEDTTPRVRERAYRLWEKAGRPYGREFEFWAEASREIEADREAERQRLQAERIVAR
ncbi:DUF2934 domain-containing protein [Aureimonas sp. Leaf454]|uniref:DUF2934 domain-containing protein n=1 Tax=Aureimonas sp. Leaf454 TaxID=1736381 RepID=UPI0009EBDC90|nr:DUF2934 domain-containing protein [Aureimonas sp. Leaf454]